MARKDGKPRKAPENRGTYEYPPGSGRYLIQYADQWGERKREVAAKCKTHSEHPPEKCPALITARNLAKQRRRDVKTAKLFPTSPQKKKTRLVDVMKEFLKESAAVKFSYRDDERFAMAWDKVLGDHALDEIKPADIEKWRREKLASVDKHGKSPTPATANRYVAFLKHVFNIAIRDGLTDKNPVMRVKQLRENNARDRFLTQDEEKRLKAKTPAHIWGMVLLAMDTGLRQAEQFGLRWDHVDFAHRVLTIPRSKHGEKRHIPISKAVVKILRALPSRLNSEWVYPAPPAKSKHGRGAGRETGHMTFPTIRMAWEAAVKAAELVDFHWHDLRHTFASRLAMAGVDISRIKELMGHKTLAMVQRYMHLTPDRLQDAVDLLEDFHKSAPKSSTSPKQPRAKPKKRQRK